MLFTVLAPLGLLLWSALKGQEVIFGRLVIYWRVSSLLMITVYLLAAAVPIGFLTGIAARLLIPLSLGWSFRTWSFGIESFRPLKNQEVEGELKSTLHLLFHRWRQVVSVYCLIGVLFNLPLLRCTFMWQIRPLCTAWLSPVRSFVGLFHPGVSFDLLGILAWVALGIYLATFTFYAFRRER